MLDLRQRLSDAGYNEEQVDAVFMVEKNCGTCLRTVSLSTPFCGECVRNPHTKDHWRARR